ncbi:hypothetical protein V8D89_008555 [Ganoderma adspersum]
MAHQTSTGDPPASLRGILRGDPLAATPLWAAAARSPRATSRSLLLGPPLPSQWRATRRLLAPRDLAFTPSSTPLLLGPPLPSQCRDPLAATRFRAAAARSLGASLPPPRSALLLGPLLPSPLAICSPFRAVRCHHRLPLSSSSNHSHWADPHAQPPEPPALHFASSLA